MRRVHSSSRQRGAPLALAVASGLFVAGVLAAPPPAAAAADTSWIRFRSDPARRLFAQLPGPHAQRAGAPAAVTRPVTNCLDDGPGSLRAAVSGAGDGDIVDLASLRCGRITLETGAILVPVDDLTVQGPGRNRLVIDGNDADRVFIHPYGGALDLLALTIEHGRDRETGFDLGFGGCIASAGYLTLGATTVRNCYAGGEGAYGGGIYAYSLTMSDSTLSGNVAYGVHEDAGTAAFGGGAFVYSMQLVDSTVSGNRADHRFNPDRPSYDIAGGIVSVHGGSVTGSTIDSNYSHGRAGGIATFDNLTISNSTFSGNVAATDIAGGLFMRRPSVFIVNNSTFSANHAEAGGGGIWMFAPSSTLQSSIVSGNTAGGGLVADLDAAMAVTIAGANNIVGARATGVHLPGDTLAIDPLLRPLAENGGPTRTHAFQPGSPAIDAGNNLGQLAFDQRGATFPRVYGAGPDIGAFEQQAPFAPAVYMPVPVRSAWMLGLLAACLALAAAWRRLRTVRAR